MPQTQNDTKVVTGRVRLSYAFLFEPRASDDDGPAKYSTAILIPKSDKKTLKAIQRAYDAAAEAGKGRFNGKVPKNLKTNLHDGDEEKDTEEQPEYAGHMYMTVSSRNKPSIVDRDREEITDNTEVYSGCYARVSMNAYAYNTNGNKGLTFGLNHVQKLADGDNLGGRSRVEDDFDDLDDDDLDEDDDLL